MGILGLMVCYWGSGSDRIVLTFFSLTGLLSFFFLQVLEGDIVRRDVVLKLKVQLKRIFVNSVSPHYN